MTQRKFLPLGSKTFSLLMVILVIMALESCKKQESNSLQHKEDFSIHEALKLTEENIGGSNAADACADVHYGYEGEEGPEHWSDLCAGWSKCSIGQAQSPVAISNVVSDKTLQPLDFQWGSTTAKIVNNGHTIQFNVDPGSKLKANGKTYDLLQFHYHHSSEHTIKDKFYPLEVHYVHKSADNKLAVIGVMFKEGAPNSLFNTFLADFPAPMTTFSSSFSFDLSALLPKNLRYYNYEGSLTTPNCAEDVKWHVLKGTVTASKEQIEKLKHILHNNNRPIQPLNGRTVRMSIGSPNGAEDTEE